MDNADGVPSAVWLTPGWGCGHGGRVLSGLHHGQHTYTARTVDQALRTSTTPLEHTWVIDSVQPVIGLVRAPPILSNSLAETAVFGATERLSALACDLDGSSIGTVCTTALARHQQSNDNLVEVDLTVADGPQRFALGGQDLAGNPTESTVHTLEWTVDTVAPNVTINDVTTRFGGLRAAASTESGAGVNCTLSGSTSAGPVTIATCKGGLNGSHCQSISMSGLPVDAAAANGVYRVRLCGDHPCEANGRVIYTHVDQPVSMYFADPGWVVERHGSTVAIARVLSRAERPESITDGWSSPSGVTFPAVKVHCGPCAGLCPRFMVYDDLPSGTYTLCVSARDAAGNLGPSQCVGPLQILTAAAEAANRTAASLADTSASARSASCDAARRDEIGLAIASAVGFAIFTVAISLAIYTYRWRIAATVAAGQKAAAILSSTTGFSDARFEGTDMGAEMMF